MALVLPITRDIVLAEKRDYTIALSFCDLGVVPSSIIAKAFPAFAYPRLFDGFLEASSSTPVRKFFEPGENLWRTAGTKLGRYVSWEPEGPIPVATQIMDASAIVLQHSLSNGVLTVTFPFATSFTRTLNPLDGSMSKNDMDPSNSPAKYAYGIFNGETHLCGGWLDIPIDSADPTSGTIDPPRPPTVCSVKVT